MFCTNCGFENSDESLYCIKCGKALNNESSEYKSITESQEKVKGERPSNNFVLAFISAFLCVPLGVVALIYSNRSEIEWNMHRPLEAKKYADKAKTWAICSLSLAVVLMFFFILLTIIEEIY